MTFRDVARRRRSTSERPGLAELTRALEAGDGDVVIPEDTDRPSRCSELEAAILERLRHVTSLMFDGAASTSGTEPDGSSNDAPSGELGRPAARNRLHVRRSTSERDPRSVDRQLATASAHTLACDIDPDAANLPAKPR